MIHYLSISKEVQHNDSGNRALNEEIEKCLYNHPGAKVTQWLQSSTHVSMTMTTVLTAIIEYDDEK